MTRKYAGNIAGKPFKKGNPGRPKGSLNKVTLAAQALLDGEAEALTRKAIDKALDGDVTALRLCMERLCPPRKMRPVTIALPNVKDAAGVASAQNTVVQAVASGEVTPDEGIALTTILDRHRKSIETLDLEARITALEEQ